MILALCRDCLSNDQSGSRCSMCGSPRLLRHAARDILSIAHVDCDAFYASIEKRDNPALRSKPLIVGGGRRGVVATCCYIARMSGVKSAMPMYKALEACPAAVVVPPDMAKYKQVSQDMRVLMEALTPIIEPLSLDEAFLDMSGTARLHHASPAVMLADFQKKIETELGISVSIGLSVNKFLAKFASDLNKPRGFTMLSQAEGRAALAPLPVERLWGVGAASARRLNSKGFRIIADLQNLDDVSAYKILGDDGVRLSRLARGEDHRRVNPNQMRKSISAETTFNDDHAALDVLEPKLRDCAERVGRSLRAKSVLAKRVHLKLKTAKFQLVTRSRMLSSPSSSTAVLVDTALPLLRMLCDGTHYRLIGIGADLADDDIKSDTQLMLDPRQSKRAALEHVLDGLRTRLGTDLGFGSPKTGRDPDHVFGVDED
jgi:DNA polymerase IV